MYIKEYGALHAFGNDTFPLASALLAHQRPINEWPFITTKNRLPVHTCFIDEEHVDGVDIWLRAQQIAAYSCESILTRYGEDIPIFVIFTNSRQLKLVPDLHQEILDIFSYYNLSSTVELGDTPDLASKISAFHQSHPEFILLSIDSLSENEFARQNFGEELCHADNPDGILLGEGSAFLYFTSNLDDAIFEFNIEQSILNSKDFSLLHSFPNTQKCCIELYTLTNNLKLSAPASSYASHPVLGEVGEANWPLLACIAMELKKAMPFIPEQFLILQWKADNQHKTYELTAL